MAKTGSWLKHGWHVAVAYVIGFLGLLAVLAIAAASFCNDISMPGAWTACMEVGNKYVGTIAGTMADKYGRKLPLTLSISSRLQQALEHELLDAMTTFSAIGAAGIVMDIHTGEILAFGSLLLASKRITLRSPSTLG